MTVEVLWIDPRESLLIYHHWLTTETSAAAKHTLCLRAGINGGPSNPTWLMLWPSQCLFSRSFGFVRK